jgi:hypothetical protein
MRYFYTFDVTRGAALAIRIITCTLVANSGLQGRKRERNCVQEKTLVERLAQQKG